MRSSIDAGPARPNHPLPRILIVDDQVDDARELGNTMASRGYDLKVVHNSMDALNFAIKWQPTVAILDVHMPGMSGLTLSARLKEQAGDPIVIFVTNEMSKEMRNRCMEAGDDYITKPFDGETLLLLVRSRLRRHERERFAAEGGEPLSPVNDRTAKLTQMEARLLDALVTGAGDTVTRDDLLRTVWGVGCDINDNTLDRTIRRLREKIEIDPKRPRVILTVRREGYRLNLYELDHARFGDD